MKGLVAMARAMGAIGVVVVVLAVTAVLNLRVLWPATAAANAVVNQTIRTVRIDNDSGDVRIRAGAAGAPTVRQRFSWGRFLSKPPKDAYRIEGDRLVLRGCGWNCSVDYEVTVPRGTAVAGRVDSGNLTIDGAATAAVSASSGDIVVNTVPGTVNATADSGNVRLSGIGRDVVVAASSGDIVVNNVPGTVKATADSGSVRLSGVGRDVVVAASSGDIVVNNVPGTVKATADSGSVRLSGVGRDVTVEADAGDILGERLRGRVKAAADSGTVRLALDAAQDVRAQTDSGDIELTVPNARYRVQGNTSAGEREIRVPTDPAAPHLLELITDSGSVTVRPAG